MIDNIYPSLLDLNNEDVIDTIDNIIKNGTEADHQIKIKRKNGLDKLLIFLMDDVKFNVED